MRRDEYAVGNRSGVGRSFPIGPVPKTMLWTGSGSSGEAGEHGEDGGDADGVELEWIVARWWGRLSFEKGTKIWFVFILYIASVSLSRRCSTCF